MGACITTYSETPLPTNAFADTAIFPFWDDLYLYANTLQDMYCAAFYTRHVKHFALIKPDDTEIVHASHCISSLNYFVSIYI